MFRYAAGAAAPMVIDKPKRRGRAVRRTTQDLPQDPEVLDFQLPATVRISDRLSGYPGWPRIRDRALRELLRTPLQTPQAMLQLGNQLSSALGESAREFFIVFGLDSRLRVVAWWTAGVGTVSGVMITPKEIYAPSVAVPFIAKILVVHNHPSGDPTPSAEDLALTSRVEYAGEILGIPLLDHLVVARNGYASLAEMGHVMPGVAPWRR